MFMICWQFYPTLIVPILMQYSLGAPSLPPRFLRSFILFDQLPPPSRDTLVPWQWHGCGCCLALARARYRVGTSRFVQRRGGTKSQGQACTSLPLTNSGLARRKKAVQGRREMTSKEGRQVLPLYTMNSPRRIALSERQDNIPVWLTCG